MIPYLVLMTCMLIILGIARKQKEIALTSLDPIFSTSMSRLKQSYKRVPMLFYYILSSIAVISLIIFAGLRDNVGYDYPEYLKIFYSLNARSNWKDSGIELGFTFINRMVGSLTNNNASVFFIVCAAIITIPLYKSFARDSAYIELTIFLFIVLGFYADTFNVMRQFMSSAIIFVGFKYVYNRKFIKFLLVVLFASIIHISAFFFIPLYFFFILKNKDILRIAVIVFAFITIQYIEEIFGFFYNLLKDTNFRYLRYLNTMYWYDRTGLRLPLFSIITYVVYLYLKMKGIKFDNTTESQINILIVGLFFAIVGQKVAMMYRIQFLTIPIITVLIPNFISKLKERQLIYILIVIGGFVYFIYTFWINNQTPYSWIIY